MSKPNIIIYIDSEEPSTHSLTPEQWKQFQEMYKRCDGEMWSKKLMKLAEQTKITPQFIVSAFDNEIIKAR